MKTLFVEKNPNTQFLGKFLTENDFDTLVTEDVDVYKKITDFSGVSETDDSRVLLKFRKNVFSKDMQLNAYEGIRDAATATTNRGIAAGKLDSSDGKFISEFQMKVLNYFMQPSTLKLDNSEEVTLEKLINQYKGRYEEVDSVRGCEWLKTKLELHNFHFMEWAKETEHKTKDEQISESRWVLEELVSKTDRANVVFSGLAGQYPRYDRIPYCRETAYTAQNKNKYEKAIPFIEAVSEKFKELIPSRYNNQLKEIVKLDSSFRIGNSVYTTLTVNKNFRTAAHTDSGDLPQGFGNLTTLTHPSLSPWVGGYLCFPEYRVAVDIRPGDLLMMDIHEIHGNTPISGTDFERISLVMYFRENMLGCQSKVLEDLRKDFVEWSKDKTYLPNYRQNGIWPGMWESEEWIEYLRMRGHDEYSKEEELRIYGPKQNTLEGFFDE